MKKCFCENLYLYNLIVLLLLFDIFEIVEVRF